MNRRRRPEQESASLSFLDAISCGFGAVILLLVLTLVFEPATLQQTRRQVQALIERLQQELAEIRGEAEVVRDGPVVPEDDRRLLARLQADLTRIRGRYEASRLPEPATEEIGQLRAARQELTEEMRRLLADYRPPANDTTVGGIPVDSEYIIFVIDTSGSMFQGPWQLVLRKVTETLNVYPRVRGIQVINDMGGYMFPTFAGRWMPDSPANRRNIINRLANWNPYSNSSPVEGLTEAINTFARPGQRISIYIYGDDFPRGQVEAVARFVDRINSGGRDGEKLVRVHAVGFPTQFPGNPRNGNRFANLMRVLAERNGGSFVALTTLN